MNKLWKLCLLALLCLPLFGQTLDVKAASTDKENNSVLLVYDSLNTTENGQEKIDTLQRVLSGMNLHVKTISQSQYKTGMLSQRYIAVITLINWAKANLVNQQFVKDRQHYNGLKLHIGQNLSQDEINQLGVKIDKLYQQQFILKNTNQEQLLHYTKSLDVVNVDSKDKNVVGILSTQEANQKEYPFGYINGKNAYLPFFSTDGLGLLTEIQLIAKLIGKQETFKPLLTITDVTPYSDLKLLEQLSRFFYDHDIPFAISTVSVSENTEMKAFSRFTAALRNVENRGGVIFLQTPKVTSDADNTGTLLSDNMSTYLVSLARHQVFPVGISSSGFWNQDKILRTHSLELADHWLLLPNASTVTHVKKDQNAGIAKESFFAMSADSLNGVKRNNATRFLVPTALTYVMPDSQEKLERIENSIEDQSLTWFDPVEDNLQTTIKTDTTILQYRHGDYFANGASEEIQTSNNVFGKSFSDGQQKTLFSKYFKIQGGILAIFFGIITVILAVFIYIGQRIYWNRFKRK